MGYEVTIRCDSGKGDPVTKRQCVTYAPRQAEVPRQEAATSRDAIYAVERRAKALGWKHAALCSKRTKAITDA